MPAALKLLGRKFGRLSVVKREAYPSAGHMYKWFCTCSCGGEVSVRGSDLVRGHTKSCGCLNRELMQQTGFANRGRRKNGKATAIPN
jgi:hypothetical protein